MNDEIMTTEDECIAEALQALHKSINKTGKLMQNYHPLLNGERYMTDREVAERLKVSRRTLQEYRNERKIPYILFGGKLLYRETDIERLLEENHKKAIQ